MPCQDACSGRRADYCLARHPEMRLSRNSACRNDLETWPGEHTPSAVCSTTTRANWRGRLILSIYADGLLGPRLPGTIRPGRFVGDDLAVIGSLPGRRSRRRRFILVAACNATSSSALRSSSLTAPASTRAASCPVRRRGRRDRRNRPKPRKTCDPMAATWAEGRRTCP